LRIHRFTRSSVALICLFSRLKAWVYAKNGQKT
jgi:hypothetical protein